MKENLFYLPPYEDEATAEKIREIYGYPIRYMKQYLLGKHGKIDPVGTDEIDPVKTA